MTRTPPQDLVLVLTTEANLKQAEILAETLLRRRLVACVSLAPVVSHYRWEGALNRSEEMQLILKTDQAHLPALQEAVMELHSYDTPEWITIAARAEGAYGRWCAGELSDAREGPVKGISPGGGPPAP